MDTQSPAGADRLSEAKRALLLRRIRGEAAAAKPVGIPRAAGEGNVHPMSFAQERMWFADRLEPGTPLYNVAAAIVLDARRLDLERMERVLTEIVRRHEPWRTVLRLDGDGSPVQVVQPPFPLRIEREDLRGALGEDWRADLRRHVHAFGSRPFDLARGPLVRFRFFRVTDDDGALAFSMHHTVTDGWSMPVIFREMETLYTAFGQGLPSPLPELPIRYADYAVWQRRHLTGETLERLLGYWRGALEGVPPLVLPYDRPRPAVFSGHGFTHRFNIPAETVAPLRELSRRHQVTLNMTLMTAFKVLLRHYSGQTDLAVATLVGNRNRKETEPLVGVFVNTAVIRTDASGDPRFPDLLAQVRTKGLEADAHQDLPFEKVIDALAVERDLSRHPVVQVMYFHHTFVKDHESPDDGEISSLNVRQLYDNDVSMADLDSAPMDLWLATVEREDGGLGASMQYSTDLWDAPSVRRMGDHFVALLERLGRDPEARLSALAPMSDAERELLVSRWGRAPDAGDLHEPLHAAFARAAAATPDADALAYAGRTWSYRALDTAAGRIAARLRALGVAPGEPVGVCLEATPELMAALLGALRAGGAYLPLDPAHPAARLAFLVRDAGARVVLTGGAHAARVPAVEGVTVVDVDAVIADASLPPAPDAPVDGASIAYVIYTSGSTGTPKGVAVPHGAAAAHMRQAVASWELRASDRVMQFVSPSFDVFLDTVLPPLSVGACVVMRGGEVPATGALAARAAAEGVTVMGLPTAYWAQLAGDEAAVRTLADSGLRCVVAGGEAMPPEAARRWRAADGGRVRLVNGYGPTEAIIYCTAYDVPAPPAPWQSGWMPIGAPLPGRRAYVLDAWDRPAPIGVPGELAIGGPLLARGYLGRPSLTAERFVPDPFSGVPGARLYRTGDRVRWLADGTLEYQGRLDAQLKVRGFRIEPGEIEAALLSHPAVRESAVLLREDAPGRRRLVAYAAAPDGVDGAGEALRAHLRDRLPDYMVPDAVVVLDAFPLTPNGKVDRRALPAPALPGAAAEAGPLPEGFAEEVLARVWAQVLGVERVGRTDSFFALGGDSILSIQMVARAAAEGVRITPRQVFQHPTLAELAAAAGHARVTAEQGEVTGPAPLTPVQRFFLARAGREPHHFNLSFLLAADAPIDPAHLRAAADAVWAHHDALRNRYARDEMGEWTQRTAPVAGAPAAVDGVDLRAVPADDFAAEVERAAAAAQATLRLEEGPVAKLVHLRGGASGDRVLAVFHHLVMDTVSWAVVQEDLATALRQVERGEPVSLPAKTTSWKAWAERLALDAESPEWRAQAAFWRDALPADAPRLPRDGPGGEATEGTAGQVVVSLDAETTRTLVTDAHAAYGTNVPDLLLTALARAAAGWTGGRGLAVDLEGHGREERYDEVDTSRTVGWFTSIHPVFLDASGDDAGAAIKRVKETIRAVPDRGLGWGILRWMAPDPVLASELAARPEPEVSVNYLGNVDAAGAPAAGRLRPAEEAVRGTRAPSQPRWHALALDAVVAEGALHVAWTFSPALHRRATIESLADAFLAELRALVRHCLDPSAGGFTPSDFPGLEGLDQGALDDLLAGLGDG